MIATILALCVVAFLIGLGLGITLRIWYVWLLYGFAMMLLGAVGAGLLLWWLGVDFGTIDWSKITGAGMDLLTASLMFNVLCCFVLGLWLGFAVVGRRVSAYVLAGRPGVRG